jgi:hypothetical protein
MENVHFNTPLSPRQQSLWSRGILRMKSAVVKLNVSDLKKKIMQIPIAEDDFKVDLTIHQLSVSLIAEFALRIAEPYYRGNLAAAIKDLMQQAVGEQEFVESHIRQG